MNDASKNELRLHLLDERRRLGADALHEASAAIADRIRALPEVRSARTVALYQALRHEIEMRPLWEALVADGKQVLFPRIRHPSRVLAFAPVDDPAELVIGSLGIREPPPHREVPIETIDVFVVPALGFDLQGGRLGRGGGYYDATLAAHPAAFRIGPCLEVCLVDQVPLEPHDQTVDRVVTPLRVIDAPARPR